MRTLAAVRIGAVAAILSLMQAGLPARGQETFNIKRTYKQGESDLYELNLTIKAEDKGSPFTVLMQLVTSETVKEVKGDGTITLVTQILNGSINANGVEIRLPAIGQSITTTLDKNGKIIKRDSKDQTLGPFSRLLDIASADTSQVIGDLKAGDEVKFEIPIDKSNGKKQTGTLTVVGIQKKSDEVPVDTIKVKTQLDSPLVNVGEAGSMKVESTALIEPATGKVLRITGTANGKGLKGLGDADITFTRVRTGAGVKPANP